MISKITKMVPKTYYVIDDVEFPADELFEVLEEIVSEGDLFDIDYSLYSCMNKLVELGYLVKRYGYHQSIVYCDTEDGKATALFNEILKM